MQVTTPITAQKIRATTDALVIVLAERSISIPWNECSTKLTQASPDQRKDAELSPGGYGIHWPQLDEDLSINGLILVHDSRVKP
ncbi:MAG: DUF2442 domain-containing protein [Candidatus Hydrogenedentes bacterium]|nr:DUF2442 domain-containing protein [Candidatus Hydrogenedentota bacterium]